jgi:hypothetical protein
MLSREASGSEVNWTRLEYVTQDEVKAAFGLKQIAQKPIGIAPNQPIASSYTARTWGLLVLCAIAVAFLISAHDLNSTVYSGTLNFAPVASSDGTQTVFLGPFHFEPHQNIMVAAQAPLDNSWLFLQGDLISETTGQVQPFALSLEYWSGVEDGEHWTEGSRVQSEYLSAVPAGDYTLRFEAQWKDFTAPASPQVVIKQGVFRVEHLIIVFLLLSIFPLFARLRLAIDEKSRWADSEFSPYGDD